MKKSWKNQIVYLRLLKSIMLLDFALEFDTLIRYLYWYRVMWCHQRSNLYIRCCVLKPRCQWATSHFEQCDLTRTPVPLGVVTHHPFSHQQISWRPYPHRHRLLHLSRLCWPNLQIHQNTTRHVGCRKQWMINQKEWVHRDWVATRVSYQWSADLLSH